MDPVVSFIPLIVIIVLIVVIIRWRSAAKYLKDGGVKTPQGHGGTTNKKTSKSSAKNVPARRKRAGPYPGIELGKRVIFGGVELKRLDKEIAADIEGRSDVNLVFDVEPEDHKYAGAFASWAEGPRINDFLGYLPKEVAEDIRKYNIFDDLCVRVDHIWIGDRGGAVIGVNIDGPPSVFEKIKENR